MGKVGRQLCIEHYHPGFVGAYAGVQRTAINRQRGLDHVDVVDAFTGGERSVATGLNNRRGHHLGAALYRDGLVDAGKQRRAEPRHQGRKRRLIHRRTLRVRTVIGLHRGDHLVVLAFGDFGNAAVLLALGAGTTGGRQVQNVLAADRQIVSSRHHAIAVGEVLTGNHHVAPRTDRGGRRVRFDHTLNRAAQGHRRAPVAPTAAAMLGATDAHAHRGQLLVEGEFLALVDHVIGRQSEVAHTLDAGRNVTHTLRQSASGYTGHRKIAQAVDIRIVVGQAAEVEGRILATEQETTCADAAGGVVVEQALCRQHQVL